MLNKAADSLRESLMQRFAAKTSARHLATRLAKDCTVAEEYAAVNRPSGPLIAYARHARPRRSRRNVHERSVIPSSPFTSSPAHHIARRHHKAFLYNGWYAA